MTAPLSYNMAEAAERLGKPFTADWLKGHLDEIPHLRVGDGRGRGGRVGFSEDHLVEILHMFEVRPEVPHAPVGRLTRRRSA